MEAAKPAPPEDDLAYVQRGMGADLDTMVVFNLLRTHNYISPALDADLRRNNLTSAQLNALLVLRQAGSAGLLMGELGQRLVVTKSNVTGLVDRLEHQGLVARAEHRDRRATAVKLTPVGARLLNRVAPPHAAMLTQLAGCLDVAEKQALVTLLTKLRRGLREHGKEATP